MARLAKSTKSNGLTNAALDAIPKAILPSDFEEPRYYPRSNVAKFAATSYDTGEVEKRTKKNRHSSVASFEMWYVPGNGFGWVIPTLLIAKATGRRAGRANRTYAVTMSGSTVRVGFGPHVECCVKVFVKNSRIKALAPYFALATKGEARANEIRDRISTRRAHGAMRRSLFLGGY